jgi:hypothetical protein
MKIVMGFAALFALTTVADAQDPQMAKCAGITGTLQRLACYDAAARASGVVAPQRTAPVAPLAPVYAPPVPAAPAPSGMGAERLPATVARQSSRVMVAGVAAIAFDPYHRFTITLDNGQVWRQVPGDETIMRDPHPARVRLTRGLLNSYDLQVIGLHASYKVARLQ